MTVQWSAVADRIEHASVALPEWLALSADLDRLKADGVTDPTARLVASTDRLDALYDAVETASYG